MRSTWYEEFHRTGKPIACDLDYDLPFIPVVMVTSPSRTGMYLLLTWYADGVPGVSGAAAGWGPPTAPRP
ncbi:hypothetical protein ADL04_02800 [Streptomyces sp. NRRL B-3648]|nr:hypothetical protein ADL04_02800 [Streptomyces sp. NRRL B-3648]